MNPLCVHPISVALLLSHKRNLALVAVVGTSFVFESTSTTSGDARMPKRDCIATMANIKTPDGTFPQFSRLPPEIRRMIWVFCLPCRVVETTWPGSLDYQIHGRCNSKQSFRENARRPFIASVCHEAAMATNSVGFAVPVRSNTSRSTWMQPQADLVMQLDFPGQQTTAFLKSKEVQRFIQQYNIPQSTVSGPFVPFSLNGINNFLDPTLYTNLKRLPKRGWDVNLYQPQYICKEPLSVFLFTIVIHAPKSAVRSCGLFGLLGDATIQLVDVDDTERIEEFRKFYRKHDYPKSCMVNLTPDFRMLLDTNAMESKIQEWRERAEWQLLAETWAREKAMMGDMLNDKTSQYLDIFCSAWLPPYVKGKSGKMSMHTRSFNEDSSWVIYARSHMLKPRPCILIRACTDKTCST